MLQRLKRKTDSISHLRKCYKGYKHDLQLYFNAHVGTDRNGFELFLGPHAVAESANDHGQRLLDTCPSNNFVIGARGRHLREFWVGGCCGGLQTLTLLKTKSVHFATLFKTKTFTFGLCTAFFVCLVFHFPYRKCGFFFL